MVDPREILRELLSTLPVGHPDREGIMRSIKAINPPPEGMAPQDLSSLLDLLPPYLETRTTRCVSVLLVAAGVEVIVEVIPAGTRTTYLLPWDRVLLRGGGDQAVEQRASRLSQAILEHTGSGSAALFVWGAPGSHIR